MAATLHAYFDRKFLDEIISEINTTNSPCFTLI